MKFISKPKTIEAEQFDISSPQSTNGVCGCIAAANWHVHTIHDNQACELKHGDWVIREPDGTHFYPCKPDIFWKTYEAVEIEKLDCPMCGAFHSFTIDPNNESSGYCSAEDKTWVVSDLGKNPPMRNPQRVFDSYGDEDNDETVNDLLNKAQAPERVEEMRMTDSKRIERLLDENFIPKEVWIGTDSIADRVEWLIKRKQLVEKRSSERFNTFADEFMILSVLDNFNKEDLTVAEIAKRTGISLDVVLNVAAYLAQKGLIAEYNDGVKGMMYKQCPKCTS